MVRLAVVLIALGLAPVSGACGDAGSGVVEGPSLTIRDCDGTGKPRTFEPFRLDLSIIEVHDAAGAAIIRMSDSARLIQYGDQLVVSVKDATHLVADTRGDGSVTLTMHADGSGEADLGLALLHRCKSSRASLGANGTITLDAYGAHAGTSLSGSMDFELVDRRDGSVVGSGLHGEFNLQVADPPFAPHDF